MIMDVTVPPVGESISEGMLVEWFYREGDVVRVDEPLFVLETDKVTMNVNAEVNGVLSIMIPAGETVNVGQVVGRIETGAVRPSETADLSEMPSERTTGPPPQEVVSDPDSSPVSFPGKEEVMAPAGEEEKEMMIHFSPAVRRMIEENQIDAEKLSGSGPRGRILKEDVIRYLESGEKSSSPDTKICTYNDKPGAPESVRGSSDKSMIRKERVTRVPMSPLRRRLSQRLVEAKNNTAMLTTFNEADMTGVINMRAKYREDFREKYGVDLGFMSFFVRACVEALKDVPELNAQIDGDTIIQNHFYDIGIAIGSERGLVVPVIRDADTLGFDEIEKTIEVFLEKIKNHTLTLDELQGGVFTISNGGIYGSLLSTPILNPPQSGILGMHAIKKRPVVVEDQLVIRPMMYLALSYDHRLVDGREAVTFLKSVVEYIENPERIMLKL